MSLKEIKDQYAQARGYICWDHLHDKYVANRWATRLGAAYDLIALKYAIKAIRQYKISELPPEQRKLFDVMTADWMKTGDIATTAGKSSKNIDAQLRIMARKDLIESRDVIVSVCKKTKLWRLKHDNDESV